MNEYLKILFYLFLVKPLIYGILGLNINNRNMLPTSGPAIIVANHNSHLDTFVLMSLFPLRLLPRIRPVAQADYFMRNPVLSWFSTRIIGILPVKVGMSGLGKHNVLNEVITALKDRNIIIFYPEGTRGKPEQLETFKRGVSVLTTKCPDVPVYPIYIQGLGKVLPKGEMLPVPYLCNIFIGNPVYRWYVNGSKFMWQLQEDIQRLSMQGNFPEWI